jgi:glycosidase
MPWENEDSWDHALFGWLRRLTALRHEQAALRRGDTVVLAAEGEVLVFARRLGDERVVVVVNAGIEDVPVPFAAGLTGRYRDLLEGTELEPGAPDARVPARSGWLLRALDG